MLTTIRIAITIVFFGALLFTTIHFFGGAKEISSEEMLAKKAFYEEMARKYPSPYNDTVEK